MTASPVRPPRSCWRDYSNLSTSTGPQRFDSSKRCAAPPIKCSLFLFLASNAIEPCLFLLLWFQLPLKHGRPLAAVVKTQTRDRTASTYYLKNVLCWSSEDGLIFTFEHRILFRNFCKINFYLIRAAWPFARTCHGGTNAYLFCR